MWLLPLLSQRSRPLMNRCIRRDIPERMRLTFCLYRHVFRTSMFTCGIAAPYTLFAIFIMLYIAWTSSFITGFCKRSPAQLLQELRYYNEWILSHENQVTSIAQQVNNTYLKVSGGEGTVSYSQVVQLLVGAYRRQNFPEVQCDYPIGGLFVFYECVGLYIIWDR